MSTARITDGSWGCVQIEYDGVKEYRNPHSGVDTKVVYPKAATDTVPSNERMRFIDRLQPRTMYTFNISAYFTDDTWGPVHQIRVETSIGGTPLLLLVENWRCRSAVSSESFKIHTQNITPLAISAFRNRDTLWGVVTGWIAVDVTTPFLTDGCHQIGADLASLHD